MVVALSSAKAAASQPSQATLHSFFAVSSHPRAHGAPADSPVSHPTEAKCGSQQIADPPAFNTQRVPAQQAPVLPQNRPRPRWVMELENFFEDLAVTRHAAQGRVLSVDVWYLHHQHMVECHAPRKVQLDKDWELW